MNPKLAQPSHFIVSDNITNVLFTKGSGSMGDIMNLSQEI
jgi:hypothetical protein